MFSTIIFARVYISLLVIYGDDDDDVDEMMR